MLLLSEKEGQQREILFYTGAENVLMPLMYLHTNGVANHSLEGS